MIKKLLFFVVLSSVFSAVSATTYWSDVKVDTVQVHNSPTNVVVYIKMKTAMNFPGCPDAYYLYLDSSSPTFDVVYAQLLVAKNQDQFVSVHIAGNYGECHNTHYLRNPYLRFN